MKYYLFIAGMATLAFLHPIQAEDATEETEAVTTSESEALPIEEQAIEWIAAFEQQNSEEVAAVFEEIVAGELLKRKLCEQLAAQDYVAGLRALRKLSVEQRRNARAELRLNFLSAIRECRGKIEPK